MKNIEKIETILKAVGLGKRISAANEIQLGGIFYLMPDVPADLNAIRELELMVIEKVGANAYGICLASEVRGFSVLGKPMAQTAITATADAPTRIAAMIAALEGE